MTLPFDVLTNGLPQSHAYDLVYRHALAIDSTGDRLTFGSTTGGLSIARIRATAGYA